MAASSEAQPKPQRSGGSNAAEEEEEERAGLLHADEAEGVSEAAADSGAGAAGGSIYQPTKDAGNICLKPGYRPGTIWEEAKQLFPLAWQTVLATVLQSMTQQVTSPGGKVIYTPPCIFPQWFSIESILVHNACVRMAFIPPGAARSRCSSWGTSGSWSWAPPRWPRCG
jgi:hypothetical protein